MTLPKKTPRELPTLILLMIVCAGLAAFVPAFHTVANLTVVGENAAFIGIMACGEGLVILSGGLDLSVGSILAVTSCTMATALAARIGWPIAAGAGLLVATIAGAINGALITYRRLPPILTTLATLLLFRHGISLLTHAQNYPPPKRPFPDAFRAISVGWVPTILFLIISIIFVVVSLRTRFGRWSLAIGGGEQATRLSGVPIYRVKRWTYILSGLCAGVAGWIIMAFTNNAQSRVGEGYELDVIAACVVGGIRITGGDGSLFGAALGATLIALLHDALILTGRPDKQYGLFTGLVILIAAVIEQWRLQLKARATSVQATIDAKGGGT